MRVITAPEYHETYYDVKVFLAGGITGCEHWQDKVINELERLATYHDLGDVVVYNPRRENFDVTNPDAEIEQIRWEHNYLTRCDIVSYFFEACESLQPITLYELGRYGKSKKAKPVITVQKGYLRERDVLIQTALDGIAVNHIPGEDAVLQHARSIAQRVQEVKRMGRGEEGQL